MGCSVSSVFFSYSIRWRWVDGLLGFKPFLQFLYQIIVIREELVWCLSFISLLVYRDVEYLRTRPLRVQTICKHKSESEEKYKVMYEYRYVLMCLIHHHLSMMMDYADEIFIFEHSDFGDSRMCFISHFMLLFTRAVRWLFQNILMKIPSVGRKSICWPFWV